MAETPAELYTGAKMGTFSNNLIVVANRLLTNYGQTLTIVRDNIGSFNPSNGTVTDSSDTNYSGVGHPSNYDASQIDGTIVQQNDIRLFFYSATEPLVNDIFTIDTIAYTAQSVRKLKAQGDNIIYIVQLRQ